MKTIYVFIYLFWYQTYSFLFLFFFLKITIRRIAEEALTAPIPEGWDQIVSESGIYYYNKREKKSYWEHPLDEYYKELYIREKQMHQQISSGHIPAQLELNHDGAWSNQLDLDENPGTPMASSYRSEENSDELETIDSHSLTRGGRAAHGIPYIDDTKTTSRMMERIEETNSDAVVPIEIIDSPVSRDAVSRDSAWDNDQITPIVPIRIEDHVPASNKSDVESRFGDKVKKKVQKELITLFVYSLN